MTIQEKCDKLNRDIHDRLFLNNYLSTNPGDYERVFTSLDLIEDCQNAIEEFKKIPVQNFRGRSTLYIYGVLQSMYCQQDGIYHLYRTIKNQNIKNIYELFKSYGFDKQIREVRDDIAGHPTDRKKGKEFYFIGKGSNSKYEFSYAGYTPHFRKVDVNLKEFIKEQEVFVTKVLDDISELIFAKIKSHKEKFKSMKLANLVDNLNYPTQLIYRGIFNDHPLAKNGLEEINEKIGKLKAELLRRYNEKIPDSVKDIFRLQDHILTKVENWISTKTLQNNLDAEIFMDSFEKQMNTLIEILKEIDGEFEK